MHEVLTNQILVVTPDYHIFSK